MGFCDPAKRAEHHRTKAREFDLREIGMNPYHAKQLARGESVRRTKK